mmetsp:Transcript_38680/g.103673  ORF Transcript_38680/g.103673 Transcript_38680/m.103673 type:complete len:214 (+) Transcript_38680:4066-4707(+)
MAVRAATSSSGRRQASARGTVARRCAACGPAGATGAPAALTAGLASAAAAAAWSSLRSPRRSSTPRHLAELTGAAAGPPQGRLSYQPATWWPSTRPCTPPRWPRSTGTHGSWPRPSRAALAACWCSLRACARPALRAVCAASAPRRRRSGRPRAATPPWRRPRTSEEAGARAPRSSPAPRASERAAGAGWGLAAGPASAAPDGRSLQTFGGVT